MEFQFYVVDVFTDKTFEWNQLSIFPLAEGLSDETIQKIAKEFNLT
ncbi:MAG: PhzF family phenazine biosynthesis protein [Nitrosopumilus sp.]|nr:PhzF family phenazine biosynthesis protein [Nitrosopumilus sp.]